MSLLRSAANSLPLVWLVALPCLSQTVPAPEYYGVFLWDGEKLQEMKQQRHAKATGSVQLSNLRTSSPRPSFVLFDRGLRTGGVDPTVARLRHIVQWIRPGEPGGARCEPLPGNAWQLPEEDAPVIQARLAPAGTNPDMARVVLTGDLSPGWYALLMGDDAHVFGVQTENFNADLEVVMQGFNPNRYQPVGTFLRQFPTAVRSPSWRCSRGVGSAATPGSSQGTRGTTQGTAQEPQAQAKLEEARRAAQALTNKYPDARPWSVRHDHGSLVADADRWPFCQGWLYVFKDRVKYEVNFTKDGSKHDFDIPFGDLREVKVNRMPILQYKAFHIKANSGQNYNLVAPGLDPSQVIAAFPAALTR